MSTDIFGTVLAGVAVFVFGQIVVKLVIEPWHEYRMLVGRIAHAIILYRTANADPRLVSPVPIDEARRELRSMAGELWQRTYAIPFYGPLSRVCWWIPTRAEIREAASNLIGMSNSLGDLGSHTDRVTPIRKALHIYDLDAPVIAGPPIHERIAERFRHRRNRGVI